MQKMDELLATSKLKKLLKKEEEKKSKEDWYIIVYNAINGLTMNLTTL